MFIYNQVAFVAMDYELLLKRGREKLPESVLQIERFEVPKVRGHVEGNKTVISNFSQIADTLRRNPKHLLKYLLKELATPGELKPAGLVLGSKVPASRINEKLQQYVDGFVLCKECGKPDTTLQAEGGFAFIKCQACGARKAVKA